MPPTNFRKVIEFSPRDITDDDIVPYISMGLSSEARTSREQFLSLDSKTQRWNSFLQSIADLGDLPQNTLPALKANSPSTIGNLQIDPASPVQISPLPAVGAANYCAFPSIIKLKNGSLLCVYSRGTGHVSSDMNIRRKISTDGGKTWGAEATVVDQGGVVEALATVMELPDGRILYVWGNNDIRWAISTDGTTIGAVTTLPTPAGYSSFSQGGKPVLLPNGSILLFGYGREATYYDILKWTGTIDGNGNLTWSAASLVHDGTAVSRQYEEPNCIRLASGRLLMTIRNDLNGTIYTSYSDNNGATWSAPVSAFAGWGWPVLCQSSLSGAIVCVSRVYDAAHLAEPGFVLWGRTFYRTSHDNGATWSDAGYLDSRDLPYLYSGLEEVVPGMIACAYSTENSTGEATVQLRYFIDGVTPLSALGTIQPHALQTGRLLGFYETDVQPLGSGVSNPTGGSTVDTECRAQLTALLDEFRLKGLIATNPRQADAVVWCEVDQIPDTVNDFLDTFTASNGTTISGRVSDSGDVWTVGSGQAATVQSNALQFSSPSTVYQCAWFDAMKKYGTFVVDIKWETTSNVLFKVTDKDNFLYLEVGSSSLVNLYKVVAGVATGLTSGNVSSGHSSGNTYNYKVIFDADPSTGRLRINCYRDNSIFITNFVLSSGDNTSFGNLTNYGVGANADTTSFDNVIFTRGALAEGDFVRRWVDLSGNGLDLVQATIANQPLITWMPVSQFGGIFPFNNHPALDFTGVKSMASASFGGAKSQPNAAIIVLYQAVTNSADNKIIKATTGTQNLAWTPSNTLYAYASGTYIEGPVETIPFVPSLVTVIWNGSQSQLRKNGRIIASGDVGSGTIDGLQIGDGTAASGFLTPAFALMDTVDVIVLRRIERYFSQKYNTPKLLPLI